MRKTKRTKGLLKTGWALPLGAVVMAVLLGCMMFSCRQSEEDDDDDVQPTVMQSVDSESETVAEEAGDGKTPVTDLASGQTEEPVTAEPASTEPETTAENEPVPQEAASGQVETAEDKQTAEPEDVSVASEPVSEQMEEPATAEPDSKVMEESGAAAVIPAAVGDLLLRDGSRVSADSLHTYAFSQDNPPVALVAYLLSDGYVVAGFPSGAGLSWAKADTTGAKKKINAIACTPDPEGTGVAEQAVSFSGDCEGEDNWAVICEKDSSGSADQAENYPAFYYAAEYGRNVLMSAALSEGWYLPSIAELYAVYANRERLNTSLACLSVDALENAYWSSSLPEVAASTSYHKSAWYLKFDDASIYSGSKTFEKYVIPIKKIIE